MKLQCECRGSSEVTVVGLRAGSEDTYECNGTAAVELAPGQDYVVMAQKRGVIRSRILRTGLIGKRAAAQAKLPTYPLRPLRLAIESALKITKVSVLDGVTASPATGLRRAHSVMDQVPVESAVCVISSCAPDARGRVDLVAPARGAIGLRLHSTLGPVYAVCLQAPSTMRLRAALGDLMVLTVKEPAGGPIEGATARILRSDALVSRLGPWCGLGYDCGFTDAGGRLLIPRTREGGVTVEVKVAGHEPVRARPSKSGMSATIAVKPRTQVALGSSAVLGSISRIDSSDGSAPIGAGQGYMVVPSGGVLSWVATSGHGARTEAEKGSTLAPKRERPVQLQSDPEDPGVRFHVRFWRWGVSDLFDQLYENLPPGPLQLSSIGAPNRIMMTGAGMLGTAVVLRRGEIPTRIALTRANGVSKLIEVVDRAGKPVRGCSVSWRITGEYAAVQNEARRDGLPYFLTSGHEITDTQGRARLLIPDGAEVSLLAWPIAHGPAWANVGEDSRVKLVVDRPSWIIVTGASAPCSYDLDGPPNWAAVEIVRGLSYGFMGRRGLATPTLSTMDLAVGPLPACQVTMKCGASKRRIDVVPGATMRVEFK